MPKNDDEIREAMSELETSPSGASPRTSITFQAEPGYAEWLERFAFAAGQKRTHPTTKRVEGNTSWAINQAVGYLRAHLTEYMAERSAELSRAMDPDDGGE